MCGTESMFMSAESASGAHHLSGGGGSAPPSRDGPGQLYGQDYLIFNSVLDPVRSSVQPMEPFHVLGSTDTM